MTDRGALDEAALVWVGSTVLGVDPADLAGAVDVTALTAVVADADAATDPVGVAAAVLTGIVARRPFPTSNGAIGWLAATDVLCAAGWRIETAPEAVVALCRRIRSGEVDVVGATAALCGLVVEGGRPCPACGRHVYVDDVLARRSVFPGSAAYELTVRCAFEHGAHDRTGRPVSPPGARATEPPQPVLARGACGSFLVAGDDGALVVVPTCDDPPLFRVVEVDGVGAGDLVGRWDALVERSTTVGFVAAEHVALHGDRLDLRRLRRALRAPVPEGAVS